MYKYENKYMHTERVYIYIYIYTAYKDAYIYIYIYIFSLWYDKTDKLHYSRNSNVLYYDSNVL
jgi:hypothetical protein